MREFDQVFTTCRRYTAVLDALYKETRLMCSNCGMRFSQSDQLKYSRHLDWHFKQNRSEKLPTRQAWRNWYIASEVGLDFVVFIGPKIYPFLI